MLSKWAGTIFLVFLCVLYIKRDKFPHFENTHPLVKRNTPRRGGIAIEWIGAIDQALRRSAILEEALIAICPLRGQNKLAFPSSIAISPLRGVHSMKSN